MLKSTATTSSREIRDSGSTIRASPGGGGSVQAPAARDAFELVLAGVFEPEPASGDEILDGPRH
jgi:hypothetical protein